MIIRTALSIFIFLASGEIIGQIRHPQKEVDHVFNDLKGDIESCTVFTYDAKEYFGELKKSSDIHKQKTIKFDSLNRAIHFEEFRNGTQTVLASMFYSSENQKITFSGNEKNESFNGTYILNLKNQVLERENWKNDTLTHKETAKYNDKDSLVEYVRYNQEGKKTEMKTWEYNKMNCLTTYTYLNENGYWQERHKYDNAKKKLSTEKFDINGNLQSTTTYKYDDKNRLIQELTTHSSEASISKTLFEYNLNNQLIRETRYYSPNGVEFYLRSLEETLYDAKKRKVNESNFNYYSSNTSDKDDWSYRYTKSYLYDENGNLSENTYRRESKDPGDYNHKSKSVYTSDAHGNWIKIIESSSDNLNQPFELMDKHIIERTITYRN